MSLAAAIAEATGLDPDRDFQVKDDNGIISLNWDSAKLGPTPTQSQLDGYVAAYDAKQPQRDLSNFIASITNEYVQAMVANDLFQDSKPLSTLIAKVDAFKKAQT